MARAAGDRDSVARPQAAQTGAKARPHHPERHEKRGTEARERLFDGEARREAWSEAAAMWQ
jgi:hypothetical protein